MIYLDAAATSYPKPQPVVDAVMESFISAGGNPGRSGHKLAIAAARTLSETRLALAEFLAIDTPDRLVLSSGCTYGLNVLASGVALVGDIIVTSSIEHNSLARPLAERAKREEIQLHKVRASANGRLDPAAFADLRRTHGPLTAFITGCSNLLGSIVPLSDIRAAIGEESLLLVDAAQIAGSLPPEQWVPFVDGFAAPGHKSMLGPQGTGFFWLRPDIDCESFVQGGTGSKSELPTQPTEWPDAMESGTPNTPGHAGLFAAVEYLRELDRWQSIAAEEHRLWQHLVERLQVSQHIEILSETDPNHAAPIVTVRMSSKQSGEVLDPSEVAFHLDYEYNIAARPGLHCAPDAHRTCQTFPDGALRLSVGHATTDADVDAVVAAIDEITGQ